jgi:hypothetical protein
MRRGAFAVSALVVCALVDGAARADSVCESNLMIVLDRSCSMQQKPSGATGGATKWQIAGTAITNLTTQYKGKLRFGLIMFPDQTGQACLQDGPIYVNVGVGTESTVVAKITGTMPTGPCETPIDTAIGQISSDPGFGATPDPSGRRSFAVLITDGEQSGGCGGTARDSVTVMDLAKLYQQGYDTYVVGFGGAANPTSLDKFAVAGGLPQMGATKFIKADDQAALDAALNAIAGAAVADEISGCTGAPCPDGRCTIAGQVCIAGVCQAPPPDGGNGNGDGGGGSGGRGHAVGCNCDLAGRGGAPLAIVLVLLLVAALRVRRARSR